MRHTNAPAPAAVHTQRGRDIYLLTPKDAGQRLGVSESTIYRLISTGQLRTVNVALPGRERTKTRVRSDDLDTFIDSSTVSAPLTRQSA